MISAKNISKTYKTGTHALNNINLEIKDNEFVYIIGKTGSGKSTFIKVLDGEEKPTKGQIIVNDYNVGRLRKGQVQKYRRNIGVVFQDFRLLPKKTVHENIAYALEVVDMPGKEIRERVRAVLKLVDLEDKFKSYPHQLSGGQQQRVAIARAIANNPSLLIADEPTGNLDPEMSNDIMNLLEKIHEKTNATIIIVTHNMEIIKKHPYRTITISHGQIESDLTREQVIMHNFDSLERELKEDIR